MNVRAYWRPSGNRRGVHRQPRAMILVVVLVVVSLLSLAALTFSQLMFAEREATELAGRRIQARALVNSGIDYVRLLLAQDEISLLEMGGVYDNSLQLSGALVVDDTDAKKRGRFTVVAPNLENGYFSGIRYGLEDESTKLNLNYLAQKDSEDNSGRDTLMLLPGMTEDIADAILDWIDADDTRREFGAELEDYSALVPAYASKNGPLDSLDELLLVRGVTPWLLYGVDANRNTNADQSEPSGETLVNVDNSDGALDRGWSAYLTVHSYEGNTTADGKAKINLNQDNLETLHGELEQALTPEWATFIVGYRQNGPSTGNDPATTAVPTDNLDFSGDAQQEIKSVLDLVGVTTQVKVQGQEIPTVLAPQFPQDSASMQEYLPMLLDAVTTVDAETISGRININQASRTVLLTIPGMTEEIAEQIVGTRIADPIEADDSQACPLWPLVQGLVDLETMKNLEPYVCTGGSTYRAQVVGYFDGGGPFARVEVVIDATQSPAAVLSWKDMSHLGRGYPLEALGIE
ncbi:MAG: type II secretion system protein GspK [Pirellulales bacterium]|nr:type II secretion system protein GspK [Thermoguttaceae bacterium]MDD4787363.1 type II secretion system protein GspK [Pirellulales bacterium]NLZ01841.1 hypothetical protein [Pirellulaceae bacterium]